MTDNPGVVHLHVMVRPDQRAMLVSYAKHGRHISLSEALRAYLDETKVLMAIVAAGSRSSQQAGHTGQQRAQFLAAGYVAARVIHLFVVGQQRDAANLAQVRAGRILREQLLLRSRAAEERTRHTRLAIG